MRARFRSSLYRGELMHARADRHARRVFRYPLYVAALDLDELPALARSLRLFSRNRRNLFSLRDADYTTAIAAQPPRTTLITNLAVAGYVFNPVSFFLHRGRGGGGEIESAVAEVNNTYGGRYCYQLGAHERIADGRGPLAGAIGFRHERELFVSPFLHGHASYDFYFRAAPAADELAVEMHVHQPAPGARADVLGPPRRTLDPFAPHSADPAPRDCLRSARADGLRFVRTFTARFTGTRVPLSDRALLAAALRYPLMTAQVIALIHLEALKLRWLGAPYRRPGADHKPIV